MSGLNDLADDVFERYSPYPGLGFKHHCLRLVDLARAHARAAGQSLDDDLLYTAAMLHDLGLLVEARPGTDYLSRSVEVARDELGDAGLSAAQWADLELALLTNHGLRLRRALPPLAAHLRTAVKTEHSLGRLRGRLATDEVRAIFARHPRDNFNRVLADFFWRTLSREPRTVPRIFLPRS
jgi:hypothetical protein